MGKIKLLPEVVANKIAAGEVVERPASVVKELIENAIDAGAARISVDVQDGGRYVRIVDNGMGMSAEDAALCVHRHTTSKIYDADDLYQVKTLGFRGEALASIASVSKMTIVTATKDAKAGTRIQVNGGNIVENSSCAPMPGSNITINELFYNTPARRKFMKSKQSEMTQIARTIMLQALVHPEITFHYSSHNRVIYDLPASDDPLVRIQNVFGTKRVGKLMPVEFFSENLSITGFISYPEDSRKDRKHQCIFVNNRPVSNQSLYYSIKLAYQDLVEVHRFPVVVLYINIQPDLIDVNVHPTKYEIRFHDSKIVEKNLRDAIRKALTGLRGPVHYKPEAATPLSSSKPQSLGNLPQNLFHEKKTEVQPVKPLSGTSQALFNSPGKNNSPGEPVFESAPYPGQEFRILGQLQETYILTEYRNDLYLIDQHAMHEKILYYEIKEEMTKVDGSQTLLLPVAVEIPPHLLELFEAKVLVFLNELGYQIESFGGNTYVIKALPSLLKSIQQERFIIDLLDQFASEKVGNRKKTVDYMEKFISMVCCKRAVKGGKILNHKEMSDLVKTYFSDMERYRFCPHGRPVAMIISDIELTKFFHRDY